MNDKELDELLSELADDYEDEFDLEAGLDRLRADGHGFPGKRGTVEDETFPHTGGRDRRAEEDIGAGRTPGAATAASRRSRVAGGGAGRG